MNSPVKHQSFFVPFCNPFLPFPPPGPLTTTSLLSVTLDYFAFSRILCKCKQYVLFLPCFFSQNYFKICSCSLCSSFLFVHSNIWIHHSLHIHSPADWWLGCLQYSAMTNKTAMHIHVQGSKWVFSLISLSEIPLGNI